MLGNEGSVPLFSRRNKLVTTL